MYCTTNGRWVYGLSMTTETSSTLPTAAQYSIKHAQRRIHANANGLRDLAEKFDRIAEDLDRVPSVSWATAIQVASQIIQEHAVWLSNAHLETAIQYAAESDQFRATGE